MLSVFVLCVAASTAFGRYTWNWTLPTVVQNYHVSPHPDKATDSAYKYFYLTDNNGSHAVAMTEYDNHTKVWTSILAERLVDGWAPAGYIRAYEYSDIGTDWGHWQESGTWPYIPPHPEYGDKWAVNCHVANNASYRAFTWGNIHPGSSPHDAPDAWAADGNGLTDQSSGFWDPSHQINQISDDSIANDSGAAVALFRGPSGCLGYGCVVYDIWDHDQGYHPHYELCRQWTTDGGSHWYTSGGRTIASTSNDDEAPFSHPSLATDDVNGNDMYLAYQLLEDGGAYHVMFRKSTDRGHDWGNNYTTDLGGGLHPCIAAVGQFVFVCWSSPGSNSRIKFRYSTNGGEDWLPGLEADPAEVPFLAHAHWDFDHPNVAAVPCLTADYQGLLIVAKLRICNSGDIIKDYLSGSACLCFHGPCGPGF